MSLRFWFLALATVSLLSVSGARAETKGPTTIAIPTDDQIKTLAAMLPAKPRGVGRPITDRAAWAIAMQQPFFQKQLVDAAKYAAEPIPAITDDLYYEFLKDGKRDTYEHPYDLRTKRLIAFVIAEGSAADGKYLPLIEAELNAILTERTWILPDKWPKDDPREKARQYDIDLAVAARAWTVATTDYWIGDKLKPETRALVRAELKKRVFDPYEDAVKTGKVKWWWMAADNNWNAVCTAGMLGTALTMIDSPEERALYVQEAKNSMAYYLAGLQDDGYCYEGMGYWEYGFGNYLCIAEMLYRQTHGKLNLYQGDDLRSIALYPKRMEMLPGVFPSFGDASAKIKQAAPELMELVNQRWGMGWTDIKVEESHMYSQHPLSDRLFGFGLFGFPPPQYGDSLAVGSPALPVEATTGQLRYFFEKASVLITRSQRPGAPDLALALKGGDCGHNHGHNDSGTFVVGTKGSALVLDPGMEIYTHDSFGPHRFESMMMNSYGHDVPYIGNTLQKGGAEAFGKITNTNFTDDKDTVEMDLTTSYTVPSLTKVTRTYIFDRTKPSVEIIDTADFTSPTAYGCALIVASPYTEKGPGSFLIYEPKTGAAVQATVTLEGADAPALVNKIEPLKAHQLPASYKPERLGYNLDKPVTHVVMHTLIVPTTAP